MNILVVDDEEQIREILSDILVDEGHNVVSAEDGPNGLVQLTKEAFDLCFLDVWMPEMGGLDVLRAIKQDYPAVQVVMISGHAQIQQAVEATKLGAFDFIEKPLTIDKILGITANIQTLLESPEIGEERVARGKTEMIGGSQAMVTLREFVENASKSDARILILGENGTGKELVARSIHEESLRRNKPFVDINCAAIPENLIESELFGHLKGAFTGATSDRAGKFEAAAGGTLFMDEVADMSLQTQAKVLRVLQDMKVTRIGATASVEVDVRIIAATNKDIPSEIKEGRFREDLYYRLNVIPIKVPALRERVEDIPELVDYFQDEFSSRGVSRKSFAKSAVDCLMNHSWPGNVRQLRNIVERLTIITTGEEVTEEDVKKHIVEDSSIAKSLRENERKYDNVSLNDAREEFEKEFIEERLIENSYNISRTAKVLGVYPSNLYTKLNKLGISIDELKKERGDLNEQKTDKSSD
jgi:two-component system nitrogen regulation response regulator NtrX